MAPRRSKPDDGEELAETSVHLNVRPWVRNEDYAATKRDLTEEIKSALDEQGITIPYPRMEVHLGGESRPG